MTSNTAVPRLCLMLELLADAEEDAGRVHAILDEIQPASLILCEPATATENDLKASVIKTVEIGRSRGVATLVCDRLSLAIDSGADGVHLTWKDPPLEGYRTARLDLGPTAIIGVDAGSLRHDAMELGEAGVTYVAFGPDAELTTDDCSRTKQCEQIAWWTELFEIPALALEANEPATIRTLTSAGADLVSARIPATSTRTDIAELVGRLDDAANPLLAD